ncbi:hypothetical protein [Sodalis sp. (in: enterobacteria)]|uniref:hypothetical protein n=1 Tax=Sodalis sp. (in: enterobacteria) TaxID=1898979 RepID=UPI003F343CFF
MPLNISNQQPVPVLPSWSPSVADSSTLKNSITGAIIKVKNYPCDFRVIKKEKSLSDSVKSNVHLKSHSYIDSHISQGERFRSLGMAVTVVYNIGKDGEVKKEAETICKKHPKKQDNDISLYHSLNKRGQDFISTSFLKTNSQLDATNYAQALNIGHDAKNGVLDPFLINTFQEVWQLRNNSI